MSAIVIDGASLLAQVEGGLTLTDAERALEHEGLTLGLDGAPMGLTFADWLGAGAPGARPPWLDPADHLIAGIDATLPNGDVLSLRPAPRRAVGPDLVALFFGTHGRFGKVERAWIRVHPREGGRAAPHVFEAPATPPINAEAKLFDAIAKELGTK